MAMCNAPALQSPPARHAASTFPTQGFQTVHAARSRRGGGGVCLLSRLQLLPAYLEHWRYRYGGSVRRDSDGLRHSAVSILHQTIVDRSEARDNAQRRRQGKPEERDDIKLHSSLLCIIC